ncbi:hypothetical protein [Rhodovulum kholense]|uniref:hypothetical protein n=1 Tax=Rhodovulum kholense TaxID=453584 RepID=UPI001304FEB4|nr:hypothetical protein [Rhodovulum kholense]
MKQRLAPAKAAQPGTGKQQIDKMRRKRPQPADLTDSEFRVLDFHKLSNTRQPGGNCIEDDIFQGATQRNRFLHLQIETGGQANAPKLHGVACRPSGLPPGRATVNPGCCGIAYDSTAAFALDLSHGRRYRNRRKPGPPGGNGIATC